MNLSFAAQPWGTGFNLDDYFDRVGMFAGETPVALTCITAWAKRSGIELVSSYWNQVQTSGGTVELIVGIDEGGATSQGLQLAVKFADKVGIFHDRVGRTFHPKVYIARALDGTGRLVYVGSNNLTAGGVHYNYEAGLLVEVAEDSVVASQLDAWIIQLKNDAECYRLVDENVLKSVVDDPRYRIGDEDESRSNRRTSFGGNEQSSLFQRSMSKKKRARRSDAQTSPSKAADRGGDDLANVQERLGSSIARWSKRLQRTDAQQTPVGTSPTGNLRLAAAKHPIDIAHYFRDEFFGHLNWMTDSSKPGLEFVEADIEVVVDNTSLQRMTFRIDHQASRIAGQSNVPTVLKWGPMSAMMRATSYVGHWVLIERRENGYLMALTAVDPNTIPLS